MQGNISGHNFTMSEAFSVGPCVPVGHDRGDHILTDFVTDECKRAHTLVIVHSSPLLQLGLASTIIECAELSNYCVRPFTTTAEASETLANVKSGDIILFDSHSWLELNRLKSATASSAAKACRVPFGLLLPLKQTELNGIQSGRSFGLISLDAESADVITIIKSIAERSQRGTVKRNEASQGLETLTSKQLQLLELIAEGLSNKQISSRLGISEGTVKSHVTALLKKLRLRRRTQLAVLFSRCF